MITTTLNRIKRTGVLRKGDQEQLLKILGKAEADDEPLPFARIVEIIELEDAILCFGAEPQYAKEAQAFAVWCVRRVEHLMTDQRSLDALNVAERYAKGDATQEELRQALEGAREARRAVNSDMRAALHAAKAAEEAAHSMVSVWVSFEADRMAWAVRGAVEEAWSAAAEEKPAVAEFERAAQMKKFLRIINETEAKA